MNIVELQELLPHRYPFLLVDRVLESNGNHFRAIKNVTINEPFFQGHFPGYPVMPGVLILESMAQASVAMVAGHPEFTPGQITFLARVEEARFRRPVIPGDQLVLSGELLGYRLGTPRVSARAEVEGELAAEAKLTFVTRNPA